MHILLCLMHMLLCSRYSFDLPLHFIYITGITPNPQNHKVQMTEKLDSASKYQPTIRCPFCVDGNINAEPGKSECPSCRAKYEIDDRVECLFVDLDNLRLPLKGTYCRQCGLVQGGYRKHRHFCGALVRIEAQ